MPTSGSPRAAKRNRRVVASDDESEAGPSQPSRAQAAGRGKRPRTSRAADPDGGEDDDDEDGDGDGRSVVADSQMDGAVDSQVDGDPSELAFRPVLERGDDGFVAGSIVRVKLRNFMTYDFVEFRPGPHLNMIVGVNGTGKSSIAGAIAIGLGFPPKLMGRSTEIQQFVKQGTEVAELEIEIKGRRGQRNPVVFRRFRKDGKGSEFRLNGQQATHKEIKKLVEGFGVQADNLCSFLPQDKVANFAKMNPGVVLTETMRAAGDSRLTDWYNQLKEKGEKAREVDEREVERRDHLQKSVDALAPDVQNFNNLRHLETDRDVLTLNVASVKHSLEYKRVNAMKKQVEEAKEAFRRAEQKSAPLDKLCRDLSKKAKRAAEKNDAASDQVGDLVRDMNQAGRSAAKAQGDAREVDNKLAALRNLQRRREGQLQTQRDNIRKADAVLNGPQEDPSDQIAIKTEERKRLKTQESQVKQKSDELSRTENEQLDEISRLKREINPLSTRLVELTDKAKQRERAARDFDASINHVLDYIREHEADFQETVYAPAMVSVSVTDPALAAQVEACTSMMQRSTFITTNLADYRKLLDLQGQPTKPYQNSKGQRVSSTRIAVHIANVTVTEQTANPPRPCPIQQVHDLGFDGYAIDFVEAPAPVMTYLAQRCNLHRMVVTKRDNAAIDNEKVGQAGLSRWATRVDVTNGTRSRYGGRHIQTTTTSLPPARAFNMTVDQQAVERAEAELGQRKRRLLELEKPAEETARGLRKLRDQEQQLKEELGQLDAEIVALRREANKAQKAHADKQRALAEIARIEAQPTAREEREKLQAEKLKFAKAQLGPLKRYQNNCEQTMGLVDKMVATAFGLLQSKANSEAAAAQLATQQAEFDELRDAVETLQNELRPRRAKFRDDIARFEEHFDSLSREIRDRCREADKAMPEEEAALVEFGEGLEERLNDVLAQLSLLVGVSPAVVERHERLSKELEEKKAEVERRQKDSDILKRDVDRVLNKFNPALDRLVDVVSNRFSAYFERMNCSGEVRVRRVEGRYEDWGLEILVSYRNNERLQILTENRQSGGERSLATVTYLMSLCEMARTPFSLVDEINQGMDQRVERLVHDRMVDATCGDHAGQYFLITPKLLTDLTYHERMKVLVVNNGTYLPDSHDKQQRFGSLKARLAQYKRQHSIAV